MKKLFSTSLLLLFVFSIQSQTVDNKTFEYSNKLSIVAGLIQPIILKGGNIEFTYTTKRLIIDYSHGFNLNPPSMGDLENQNIVLHLPFSTGFGIGYRINPYLDVRFEPKMHSWEVYYVDETQNNMNRINDYKTFTIGAGIYYRYFPFRNNDSKLLQGITTATSLRFWPNVGSTLSHDEFSYFNKFTEATEVHKAANIGMGNTPFIFNISVGYTFGGK